MSSVNATRVAACYFSIVVQKRGFAQNLCKTLFLYLTTLKTKKYNTDCKIVKQACRNLYKTGLSPDTEGNMIKIIVDSCADLTGDLLDEYDIDYAHMNTVRDGVQTQASLRWEYFSPKELYTALRNGERITTTQVPVEEFKRIFTLYLDQGMDIIYIGCALKQSGSVNTGFVTAREILKDYPDRRIECIDALNACIGEGMLGILASKLNREGKSFDEIVDTVKAKRNNVNEFCAVHTLDFLKRAGRVTASKAFFGNLMGVKPILTADADGAQTPIKKAKGRMGSFTEMVNLMADAIENPEEQFIFLAHADCSDEEVKTLSDMVKEKINCKGIIPIVIGPIIGASIGPDAIGLWAFGKEVTYRAEA